jgi:predicted ATPase/class 3 adenylate cyclase
MGMAFTFLMTDIEGSALLWDEDATSMGAALAQHDLLVDQTTAAFNGRLIKSKGEGDATLSVFAETVDAARAAVELQRQLGRQEWPTSRPISIRIAIDSGEAEARGDDFFGPVLNRCARLRGAGHGGQILLSSVAAQDISTSAGGELKELGAFQLKGLKRPERVYQLSAEGLTNTFKPLRALDVRLHNLPEQTASSVGREDEIAEALAALRSHRLVTIWGPGGVGKTHLALRVAALLVDKVADGAWWVDLVGVNEPHLVADHVAHVLGVADPKTSRTVDDLCEVLRPRDLLLVPDNCEHLLEPLAELASRLLEACPNIQILATSRERFGVPGESLVSLGGLETPSRGSRTEDALKLPAIRLFLDRARDVGVAVDQSQASELELVSGVCKRLEGLPLAIELAAASLATMDLMTLSEELGHRLDVLDASTSRTRPGGGRRTIRGAIEWSFSRATGPEQRALVSCSVFAGSFSLDAARAVAACSTPVLLRLVEQSLISRDAAAKRYRLLGPVREFAEEVADLKETLTVARDRFLTWLIEQTHPTEPVSQEWLDLVESEMDNVRGGMALASGEDARALCEIVINLPLYWHVRGPLAEGRSWVEAALSQCDNSWVHLRVNLAWTHGFVTSFLGDMDTSERSFEEALRLARQIGAGVLEARTLGGLGAVAQARGDLAMSQVWLEQAVSRAREAGDRRVEAASVGDLGVLAAIQGEHEAARGRYETGLGIYREIGDAQGAAITMYNLGETAEALGQSEEATRLLRGAFENWNVILKDRYRAAAALRSFALMRAEQDPERAAVALGASEGVIQLVGSHEPEWLVPPRLLARRDNGMAKLGSERFDELQLMGAGMSLEEAATYVGLLDKA